MSNPLQELVNFVGEHAKDIRSTYHLTLGDLIEALECRPLGTLVYFDDMTTSPIEPHSYRGYYSDLAFAPEKLTVTTDKFRNLLLTEVLDKTFTGYKGGGFTMTTRTPLWKAAYGVNSNNAIVGHEVRDNVFILKTKCVGDD